MAGRGGWGAEKLGKEYWLLWARFHSGNIIWIRFFFFTPPFSGVNEKQNLHIACIFVQEYGDQVALFAATSYVVFFTISIWRENRTALRDTEGWFEYFATPFFFFQKTNLPRQIGYCLTEARVPNRVTDVVLTYTVNIL